MVQTIEDGRVRFESPEVRVRSPQREAEVVGTMHLSLRVAGHTERVGVTVQLSLAGKE